MPDIRLITENLADELIPGIERASGIYILTSFVMESGVRLLEPYLKGAIERGAIVRLLAGDYMYVTQPEALRRLLAIDSRMEARLWRSEGISFHPKAYLLDYGDGQGRMIVGSSNLSRSAFRVGYEWNLSVDARIEPYAFRDALDQFRRSYWHSNTVALSEETIAEYEREYWRRHKAIPELARAFSEAEEAELMIPRQQSDRAGFEPRPAQQAALDALYVAYEEGYDKALVVMATGLGKTYVAGFFARSFRRILFIAHREEILLQARGAFCRLMPERSFGMYNGTAKETAADMIFASIYTLSMDKHRARFDPRAFDLIIVDEFHHAAAPSYRAVLDYFQPAFLLGLTATPERMDGNDIYALCDGNLAYQIGWLEAITRGWLSPFHYYGVYDDIDYDKITWTGSRYDEEQLMAAQIREERAAYVLRTWAKHKQTRTIAFCSSVRQAEYISDYFAGEGVRAVCLHAGSGSNARAEAIQALGRGELEVIFTVDLFNEGVDIPLVDTLLFVRPTESVTVFLQQFGRGLRLAEGKSHCVIIDLIGNYRNADLKLRVLGRDGDHEQGTGKRKQEGAVISALAGHCFVELEVEVINLLHAMGARRQPKREGWLRTYHEVKQSLGRRPSSLELHLHGMLDVRPLIKQFKSYVGFLFWAGELSEDEERVFKEAERWLIEVEATYMNKSYKMVLLLAMLDRGPERWREPISAREAAPYFHRYLTEKEYRINKDLSDKQGRKLAEKYDMRAVASLIERMPMTRWGDSSSGAVQHSDGVFSIQKSIVPNSTYVYQWTREICLYRLHDYFQRRPHK